LSPWALAELGAALLALDPAALGGVWLKAPAGAVRDLWLARLKAFMRPGAPLRVMPAAITDARLVGGLDLSATLASGRPVAERGLLAECDGGVVIAATAERLEPGVAAQLAAALDTGCVRAERDGMALYAPARIAVVALDEGEGDECPPAILTQRLGLSIDLRGIAPRDAIAGVITPEAVAAARGADAAISEGLVQALCGLALRLGVVPLRASLHAVKAARLLAALDERDEVMEADAAFAAALALAPHATRLPSDQLAEAQPPPETEQDSPPAEPPPEREDETPRAGEPQRPPDDLLLEATMAVLPGGLLAAIVAGARQRAAKAGGRAGPDQKALSRGRVIGSRRGEAGRGQRLDIVATLRAAAPWQRIRQRERGGASAQGRPGRILVTRDDMRVSRRKNHLRMTTIFVVDASGSSALQRLGEAKGAVKLLLAECYVRRDEVALIAFRSKAAEIILPPTRALARAQRALSAMAGGGGTPIAAAIDQAMALAGAIRRQGRLPNVVFMSDGRANVARDGTGGREQAHADALCAARAFAAMGVPALFVDTSAQPQARAQEIASAMGARYLALPQADPHRLAGAISASAGEARNVGLPPARAA
jgi:magnesium chelatase subunit D